MLRERRLLLCLVLLAAATALSGCKSEGCLKGEDDCTVPSPCDGVTWDCTDGFVEVAVLQSGDDLPGGLTALASPGDVIMKNDQVQVVVEALDHPHYLGPTGGGIIDLLSADGDDDSLRHIVQATGVLPDEAAFYTDLRIIEEDGLVAVQVSGHLDGREHMLIYTRYELRPCDPGVRVRTELINGEADPISAHLADGHYNGNRELLPFAPGVGQGFDLPSFGLSTLGDAVLPAPFVAYGAHSDPASSYAQVSCTAEALSGFRSTEVSLDGDGTSLVMPRDWRVFERLWLVGDGPTISSAADLAFEARRQLWGDPWVTLTGQLTSTEPNPAWGEGLRAAVLVSEGTPSLDRTERTPWNHTLPAAGGTFSVRVPPGREYVIEVEAFGAIVSTSGLTVGADDTSAGDIDVPAVGRMTLNATIDGVEDHVQAIILPADDATAEAVTGGIFGQIHDCGPLLGHPHGGSPGCNRVLIDGPTSIQLLPGTYDVFSIAGPFSTIAAERGLVVAGGGEPTVVQLDLETLPGLQPAGTLAGDFHVHGGASFDSNMPHYDRLRAILASRLQVVATTEHDAAWDFADARAALDADDRLALMVGTENTGHILFKLLPDSEYPKVVGHWNVWPVDFDPEGPYRGAYWDEKAEPGLLMTRATERGYDPAIGVVQLNHPIGASQFGRDLGWASTLGIDLTEPLPSAFDDTEVSIFVRTPEGADFSNDAYDVQEVMNGTINGNFQVYRAFWHYLLDQGILRGGTANSDSHSLLENVVGLPLTLVWTDSTVAAFDDVEFNAALRDGRAIGTTGPVIEMSTTDADGAVRGPSLEPFTPAAGGTLDLEVRAAPWVPVPQVRIYVNGELVRTLTDELAPQPADPFGTGPLERLSISIPLDDLLPGSGDAWLSVEAGWPLEPNLDLNCDGIPDTGDNNGDGTIDWRDVEANAELEDAPDEECLEDVGPLTDPEAPAERDGPLYLYRGAVPDGYPLSFTNPLIIDRDGDGFDAPGVR